MSFRSEVIRRKRLRETDVYAVYDERDPADSSLEAGYGKAVHSNLSGTQYRRQNTFAGTKGISYAWSFELRLDLLHHDSGGIMRGGGGSSSGV